MYFYISGSPCLTTRQIYNVYNGPLAGIQDEMVGYCYSVLELRFLLMLVGASLPEQLYLALILEILGQVLP